MQLADLDSEQCAAWQNCVVVALSREIEMKKVALNLAGAPPASNVASPVVCLPIGKTSKGDLVYAMDCRDIPVEKTAMPPVSPSVQSSAPPTVPESK